jgi:hypothetical protein
MGNREMYYKRGEEGIEKQEREKEGEREGDEECEWRTL